MFNMHCERRSVIRCPRTDLLQSGNAGLAASIDMKAVVYRYRSTLRANWGSTAALSLLVGLALSFALAAAADARRTDTALPRALAAARSADVSVSGNQLSMGRSAALSYLGEIEHLPGIMQSTRIGGVYLDELAEDGTEGKRLSFGSAVGKLIARPGPEGLETLRLLKGRLPATDRPDEVMVNPELQRVTGWRIGDRVTSLRLVRLEGFDSDGNADPKKGEALQLTIVGVGRLPSELFDSAAERKPQVYLFPPFAAASRESTFYVSSALKVSGDQSAIVRLRSQVERVAARYPGAQVLFSATRDGRAAVQSALRPQVTTIWLLATVVFLAGLLLGAQAIGRQIFSQNRDSHVLRALGMSPRDVGVLVMLHGMTVAVVASFVAVALSWSASIFTPLGSTQAVEPSPGLGFDTAVLGTGALVIAATLATASWFSASRLARLSVPGAAEFDARGRPSRFVSLLTWAGLPPTAVTGSRFALQPGLGRNATPARSVLCSIALAVGVVGAAVSFTSSLNQLLATPRSYGWDWDVGVANPFGPIPDEAVDAVRARPEVGAIAAFTYGNVRIDKRSIAAVGFDQLDGIVFPTLLDGRIPQGDGDIVLGPLSMRSLGRSIGDRVNVDTGHGKRTMTIVGTATFPSIGNTRTSSAGLGRGAATIASVFPLSSDPAEGRYNGVFLRIDPTLDRVTATKSLRKFFAEQGCTDSGCFLTDGKPHALNGYESLGAVWPPFAAALGVVFAISLAHGLAMTTKARRRDLAIMAALGLTPGQAGRVVVWQAATIIAAALSVGVPFAIISANVLWGIFCERLGLRPRPSIPLMKLVSLSSLALMSAIAVGLAFVPSTRHGTGARILSSAE